MCNQLTSHHQFGIEIWRSKFEQQTDSILSACGSHKDPETIDLNEPRHAQYMHKAWKRHQNAVFWVDINLALRKGLKFYQTRSNAIILHETLPAYCRPKVDRMETGQVTYEKVYRSPRPPPKISLKHDWKRELGSEHARRPEGQVLNNPEVSIRTNQFQTQVVIERGNSFVRTDRTEQPVVGTNRRTVQDGRKTSRSPEIDTCSFHEEAVKTDRTGNPLLKRVEPKHVHLMTARVSSLKWHMIERGNPLLKQTQKMCQMVAKHVLVMKAEASTLETKQFVIERGNPL